MRRQQQQLGAPQPFATCAEQPAHAGNVEVQTLQGEQREEQHGLVAGDRSRQPTGSIRGLRGREGEHAFADVRIMIFLIRIGVVTDVLVDPPTDAQPGQQIARQQPDHRIAGTGRRDLLVAAVVSKKRHLGGGHTQQHSWHQHQPRLADRHKRPPAREEEQDCRRDPQAVAPRRSVQQPRGAYLTTQSGIVAAALISRYSGHGHTPKRSTDLLGTPAGYSVRLHGSSQSPSAGATLYAR